MRRLRRLLPGARRAPLAPPPYIAPDADGVVHVHLTADGVMPAFTTDSPVTEIRLHEHVAPTGEK